MPDGARPSTDQTRLAIFSIIAADVEGARVLDLFAGSGALGIEALSRGAREAAFVEADVNACKAIEANLAAARLEGNAEVRRADAERFLEAKAKAASVPYDLVFLDPPYERGLGFVARILAKLASGAWVSPGGTVVAEAPMGELALPPSFRETRARRFGQTQVTVAVNEGKRRGSVGGP